MKLPLPNTLEVFVEDATLNNLRILHLSDLHIGKKTSPLVLKNLIKTCEGLNCDFIVITGDIIDCKVKYIKEKLKILNTFSSKVFYISGNHDVFYGLEDLKRELSNLIFMDNQHTSINFNGNSIHLVGLSDRFSGFFNIKRDVEGITHFLNHHSPAIFIAHQPKDYDIAVNTNTSLFLCGHTHGGQIFPFHYLVRLVQPFLRGLIYKNKTAIYVNAGLGNWGINIRYKSPNEITILKLISKSVQ